MLWFHELQSFELFRLPIIEYEHGGTFLRMFLNFGRVLVWIRPATKFAFKNAVFVFLRCARFSPSDSMSVNLNFTIAWKSHVSVTCALNFSGSWSKLGAWAIYFSNFLLPSAWSRDPSIGKDKSVCLKVLMTFSEGTAFIASASKSQSSFYMKRVCSIVDLWYFP